MSESIGAIHYDLDLQDDKFKGKVKNASGLMGGLKDQFKKAEQGSNSLLAGITVAAAGVVAFGMKSVSAFNEANRAEAKLIQLHHENTGATMKQTQVLLDQADALQYRGVVEGDAIKNGQAQLATFKLSTGAIHALTPAMTDMVAHMKGANATGEDFVNVGNLIGKVMEGNIGALGRYGVSFDANQEKVLKNGNASERAAMLAKVLAQNYGGVNAALAKTPEGKIAMIKNQFGDLQEELGKLILNGLQPAMTWTSDYLNQIAENGGIVEHFTWVFNQNKEAIYAVVGAIIVGLLPALAGLAAGIWATLAPLIPFLAVGALLGVLVNSLVNKFGGWDNLIKQVKSSLTAIWNVIGPILMPTLQQLWSAVTNDLLPALQKMWAVISPVLIPALQFLAKLIGGILFVAVMVIINAFTTGIKIVSGFINIWVSLIKNIQEKGAKGIIDWFKALPGEIGKMLSGIAKAILAPFDGAFDKLKNKLSEIKNKINDALNPFVRHSPSLVDWMDKGADHMVATYENMFSRLASISSQNKAELGGAVKSVTGATDNAKQGGFAGAGTINNITINPSGIFARTPGEVTDVAVQIVEAAKRAMSGPKVKIIR